MTEETIQSAMTIILFAGDARAACMQALAAIAMNDYDTAHNEIKKATQEITKAHKAQTDEIQDEAAGVREGEYSLLFTHAQDTLMTVMSEINIAKHIIKISESFDKRLKNLEEN